MNKYKTKIENIKISADYYYYYCTGKATNFGGKYTI